MKTLPSAIALIATLAFTATAYAASSGGTMPPRPSMPRPTPTSPTQQQSESDFSKAEYLIKAERYEEAIPLLQSVVAKNARDADAWNYLGFAARHLKRNDEALGYYQKALGVDPKHKGAHEYLGELYLQMGDPVKAQGEVTVLQGLCPTGCEELEDLQQAMADYKAKNPGA